LVDTLFEELVIDKPFIETCNLLRSSAIRLDQQYKEKAARQIHNNSQLSNKVKQDKVKKVLALINKSKSMIHASQMKNQS
jgi:predicted aspartyl protease